MKHIVTAHFRTKGGDVWFGPVEVNRVSSVVVQNQNNRELPIDLSIAPLQAWLEQHVGTFVYDRQHDNHVPIYKET